MVGTEADEWGGTTVWNGTSLEAVPGGTHWWGDGCGEMGWKAAVKGGVSGGTCGERSTYWLPYWDREYRELGRRRGGEIVMHSDL